MSMLKHYLELTENDKIRFYNSTKADFERNYKLPWDSIEEKIYAFLDEAYDDSRFVKMNSDDQIEAAHCRKEFKKRPSVVDYIIWTGRFVADTEYVEMPD